MKQLHINLSIDRNSILFYDVMVNIFMPTFHLKRSNQFYSLKKKKGERERKRCSLMMQRVKDSALSLQLLGLLLWHRFHPWPRNFHMLQEQQQKTTKKKKKTQKKRKETKRKRERERKRKKFMIRGSFQF